MEGPKRILIVVGIPGVGKTTVITKTEEILLKSGSSTSVAVFGTVMLNEARKIGVNKRDEIRKLSILQQQELQNKASEHIRSIANEFIIVDTHLFVRTPSGFLPGIPQNVVQSLRPTNLVLITASPKEIHERRTVDQTRDRDILSLTEIQRELEISRAMISTISIISGAPFEIINNSNGGIDRAASQVANILKRMLLDHPLIDYIGEIGDREKSEFLGNARALLFPIDWPEPFGLVMIEAMACGTPVIAWNRGSVPEVVDHGVTGYIVDSEEEALAALSTIDRIDRHTVRAVFERRFAARTMARAYVDLYARLLDSRPLLRAS